MSTQNARDSKDLFLLALKGLITIEFVDGEILEAQFVTQDELNIYVTVDDAPLMISRAQIRFIKGRSGQEIENDDSQSALSSSATEPDKPTEPEVEVEFEFDTQDEDDIDKTILLPDEEDQSTQDLIELMPEVAAAAVPSALADDSPESEVDYPLEDFEVEDILLDEEEDTLVFETGDEEDEVEVEEGAIEEGEVTHQLPETDAGADTHEVAAELDCITGPHAGEVFKLIPGVLTIGRSSDNILALSKDKEISRKHTKISYEGGKFVVEDYGSLNGTFVNNERIEGPHYLKDGDVIMVGVSTLIYHKK